MLRWFDEASLRRARRRMKGIMVKKGLARKLVPRRRPSPPPTARLAQPSDWEAVVAAKVADIEDPDWWLKNVRCEGLCRAMCHCVRR
jgi:hypothetical protein